MACKRFVGSSPIASTHTQPSRTSGVDTALMSPRGVPVSVVFGCTASGSARRGVWSKSKSATRLPRIFSFSRTLGRGSGRPSDAGLGFRRLIGLRTVHATRRVVLLNAVGGPFRHHEQMRRQAPRRVRFEHVVLEYEVFRVRPVARAVEAVRTALAVHHHGDGVRLGGATWLVTANTAH